MRLEPNPARPTQRCKIKRVTHAPSAPCPLRGWSASWAMPALCHARAQVRSCRVVSRRADQSLEQLQMRLRNELRPAVWKHAVAADRLERVANDRGRVH